MKKLRAGLTVVAASVTLLGFAGVGGALAAPATGTYGGTLTSDTAGAVTIGWSSALSADGRRVVLGAPAADGYNGAVYVYDKTSKGWSPPTVLGVPGTTYQDIGYSVDISHDGRTIAVGALFQGGGRVYVFTLGSAGAWGLSATLTVPGLAVDNLGVSVAISADGTRVAAGDEFRASNRGSVFVWTKTGGAWSAATELTGSTSKSYDYFGSAVSFSDAGDRLAVGAMGASSFDGAVYTFGLQNGAWTETAALTRDDAAKGSRFGTSVTLSGNGQVLGVAAPYNGHGSAFAYTLRDGAWVKSGTLQPSQKSDYASDAYSIASSYDGSVLLVGLPARNTLQGAAEVFKRSGPGYVSGAMLVPSEYAGWMTYAGAGTSVALSADGRTSLLGAPEITDNYPDGAGYLYTLDGPSGFLAPAGRPSKVVTSRHAKDPHGPIDLKTRERVTKAVLGGSHDSAAVCGDAATDKTVCGVRIATDSALKPLVTDDYEDGFSAAQLQKAYGLRGASKKTVVAVVDAYANPTAVESLNTYRSAMGLGPADLTQVNQDGGATLPAGNANWGVEEMLDLEMVSAACPDCKILYVGANTASFDDLGTAVNTAVRLGAKVVSNSYGGDESADALYTQRAYYTHPGVAITASSGDYGYGLSFPAAFNTVVSVGGTSLTLNADGTRSAESAWGDAGSGCSRFVTKPLWQKDSYCQNRTVADVSAVADPDTGVAVYDAYGLLGWSVVGGTSVSAPLIAGIYGRTGHTTGFPAQRLYSAPQGSLYDVTGGTNGTCSSLYLCSGVKGFDGPTGIGAPNGVGAF